MGSSDVKQAEPLERRREIMRRRREGLKEAIGRGDDSVDEQMVSSSGVAKSSGVGVTRRSGTISNPDTDPKDSTEDARGRSAANSETSSASVPSMSEVNKGTIERARERGFNQ